MTENDPLARYAQDMRQVTVPPQLKAKTLAAAQKAMEENPPATVADAAEPAQPASTSIKERQAPHAKDHTILGAAAAAQQPVNVKSSPQRTAPQVNRARAPWAIAACLALAAGIGTFTCLASQQRSATNETPSQSAQTISPLFGNALQAYAADSDALTPANENGEIIFTRTFETGMPTGEMYTKYGYYSGCLLSFSDANAESVSLSVDRGQLYQCTIESFACSSNRQRWIDALTWKQGIDHSGSSYSEYDYVHPLANTDGKSKTDPDRICRVETCSLLGKTATLPAAQVSADAKTSIGIWTNEPYEGLSENPFDACMLALDGTRLTVEVTYTDGSTSQVEYELKAVCVQSVATGNAISSTTREVSPDDSDANPVYTLKAVPIASSAVTAV